MSLGLSQQLDLNLTRGRWGQETCGPTAYADAIGQDYLGQKSAASRKSQGLYFTPPRVAAFMAQRVRARPHMRILDPAAGAGVLLCAVVENLVSAQDPPRSVDLVAYDIDPALAQILRKVFDHLALWAKTRGVIVTADVRCGDFILANAAQLTSASVDENQVAYDVVIANPPYFKIGKTDRRAVAVRSVVYGQPNIYALFMVIAAALLRPSGDFVFITPRSFASGPYFKKMRAALFAMVRPVHTHVFDSRKDVFDRDEVLQENIILHGVHHTRWPHAQSAHRMTISNSRDLGSARGRDLCLSKVIDSSHLAGPFRLPVSHEDSTILDLVDRWRGSLQDYGLDISTGPVVAFRATAFLGATGANAAPLIWMGHVRAMNLQWPNGMKKPQWIDQTPESLNLLIPNRHSVILRRFSAKEEQRRLIAAPLLSGQLDSDMIGLENHLNYIHRPDGQLDREEAFGLAALYNSAVMDRYFRCVNGNTQVSATELRAIPLPARTEIKALGRSVQSDPTNIAMIDELVMALAQGHSIAKRGR